MKKLCFVLFLIVLTTLSTGSKYLVGGQAFYQRYGVDPTGLVLWLDQSDPRSYGDVGNWYDLSGLGNHGVQATGGNQPAITGAVGLAGSCRDFDGGTDFISVGGTILDNITDNFSVTIWVNLGSTSQDIFFIGNTEHPLGDGYDWGLYQTGLSFIFYVKTAGGTVSAGGGSVGTEAWYQVSGVYDGSDVYMYLDGVGLSSNPQTGNVLDTGFNTNLGAWKAGFLFDGKISSAVIFSRALSAAEIQRLYLKDKPRYGF